MALSDTYFKKATKLSVPKFTTQSKATKKSRTNYKNSGKSQTSEIKKYINEIANSNAGADRFRQLYDMYSKDMSSLGALASAETTAYTNEMDGGYGNDYGASVSAQAYNNYMRDKNVVVPDLLAAASSAASADTNDKLSAISVLQNSRNAETEKYLNIYNAAQEKDQEVNESKNNAWQTKFSNYGNLYDAFSSYEEAQKAKAQARAAQRTAASYSGSGNVNDNDNKPEVDWNSIYESGLKEMNLKKKQNESNGKGVFVLNPSGYEKTYGSMEGYAEYVRYMVKEHKRWL